MDNIEKKMKFLNLKIDQLEEDLDYAYSDMNRELAFDLHNELNQVRLRIELLCELQKEQKS